MSLANTNSTKRYEKRNLINKFEKKYKENPGSLLLAKGVVEHLYTVNKDPKHQKRKEKKEQEVTEADLKNYLTDCLLTSDR